MNDDAGTPAPGPNPEEMPDPLPDRLPAASLPTVVEGARAPEWWGMLALITIEAVVFAALIVSYFHLRLQAVEWPPGGIEPPALLLPAVNAGVLVLSAVPIAWGARAIRRGEAGKLRLGLAAGQALLVTFLALKVVEYAGYDYDWSTNVYGSIVWTITGLHVAHVVAVLLKSAAIAVLAWQGRFDEERHVAVQANSLYWYFVVGIWIPLFTTIYLSHRLM